MSVLYKALEKAARQNARGEPGAMAAADGRGMATGAAAAPPPPPLTPHEATAADPDGPGRPGRGRMVARILALVFLLVTGGVLAGLVLFQDEVETLLAQATGGGPVVMTPPPQSQPQSQPQPEPQTEAPVAAQAPADPASAAPAAPAVPPEDAADEGLAPLAGLPDPVPAPTEAADGGPSAAETIPQAAPSAEGAQDTAARPDTVAPPEVETALGDNIAALMAEGAARRGAAAPPPEPAPATPPAGTAAPPPPDRVGAEDVLRAERGASAALATGAPITVDRSAAAEPAAVGGVSVSTMPAQTRETLSSGYGALMRGNYAAALNAYDAVLGREPDNVSALSGRAAALHKLGMAGEARAAYERVLARQPENREALTNMIALIGDADPARALADLERLQSVAPDFSPIPAQIGMLHARLGRVGEAMGALRRAVALSPENALYHYNMAVVADRAGSTAEAASAYERVLRLIDGGSAPGGLRAQPIRDRLRYLRARL